MTILKILLTTLIAGAITVPLLSCTADADSATPSENQVATVERGNLTIDITAVGNLALSVKEDLAFDVFYPATTRENKATVAEVLVEEGESVEEGQALAELDISEWQEQLDELEDRVTTAERQLATKERDLTQKQLDSLNAEITLEDAEALYIWPAEIIAARAAVRSAESEVEEAQATIDGGRLIYDRITRTYRYQEAKTAWDIKIWTETLVAAEEALQAARANLDELSELSAADTKIAAAEEKLRTAQVKLDELLAEPTPATITGKVERNEQIEIRRMKVELAQEQLEKAKQEQETVTTQRLRVELTQGRLEDARLAVADAQKVLADAQKELDEANGKSPVITAPFAGFITAVNVEGGDEVLTGTVAVQLADPAKFEAEVMVGEMDIFQVALGTEANVQLDARPEINLPAKVTHISPTATIQQGVVNYRVKIEIQSLESAMPERPEARQRARPKMSPGELPERLRQAIEEGRITREQAEEMIRRRQQGETPFPPGGRQGQTPSPPDDGQGPTIAPEDFQLREGLTVTVSITVDERKDVLLVPNKVIARQGQETYIQVMKDGVVEERMIQTGISDFQFTEVTEGLNEGEQIIVPQGTTTTRPTTSTSGVSGQMRRMFR